MRHPTKTDLARYSAFRDYFAMRNDSPCDDCVGCVWAGQENVIVVVLRLICEVVKVVCQPLAHGALRVPAQSASVTLLESRDNRLTETESEYVLLARLHQLLATQ
eukprot:scaffold293101_cov18-Prasinocladus_malaysianus.AAC.1